MGGLPTTTSPRPELVSSMVSLMSTLRLSSLTVSRVCTEASPSLLSVSSSTVACTSVSLTHSPIIVGKDGNVGLSFLLGWAVTVTAGLMSYPIDTIRRRMMMTSGGGAKYKGSIDCARQIMKTEGFMSMMKGAGANILRGVAGAGVLAGFEKFQNLYIKWRTG